MLPCFHVSSKNNVVCLMKPDGTKFSTCDSEFRRYYDLKFHEVNEFQHKRANLKSFFTFLLTNPGISGYNKEYEKGSEEKSSLHPAGQRALVAENGHGMGGRTWSRSRIADR